VRRKYRNEPRVSGLKLGIPVAATVMSDATRMNSHGAGMLRADRENRSRAWVGRWAICDTDCGDTCQAPQSVRLETGARLQW